MTERASPMSERVFFLSDSGVEFEAVIDAVTLSALRQGYPMAGWPYPWRESSASGYLTHPLASEGKP